MSIAILSYICAKSTSKTGSFVNLALKPVCISHFFLFFFIHTYIYGLNGFSLFGVL